MHDKLPRTRAAHARRPPGPCLVLGVGPGAYLVGPTIISPPFPWRSSPPLPKAPSSLSFPYRQNLIKKPFEIWPRVAIGIARSSLFLTLFIAAGFGGAQIMGRIFPLTTLLP